MSGTPILKVLARFARTGVDHVLIGVYAANHYAPSPAAAYSTQDCDVLVRPDPKNLRKALRALQAEGYSLEAGGEPLPMPDAVLLGRLVERRAAVTGRKPGSVSVDLVLEAAGLPFSDCLRRSRLFRAGRTRVPVASLRDIMRSKRLSGREKDRVFLRLYAARLREWSRSARTARCP